MRYRQVAGKMKLFLSLMIAGASLSYPAISISEPETPDWLWYQSGNCYVCEKEAQVASLECNPYHPFKPSFWKGLIIFSCNKSYHNVSLGHNPVMNMDMVRTVTIDFGEVETSDVWMPSDERTSVMSNFIRSEHDPDYRKFENRTYRNTLNGLGNPDSTKFEFNIEPGGVTGSIPLTGKEHHAVNRYIDSCQS